MSLSAISNCRRSKPIHGRSSASALATNGSGGAEATVTPAAAGLRDVAAALADDWLPED